MRSRPAAVELARGTLALVAVAFGLATLVAGGRVLAGADPGYLVFRPLVIFNTAMGVAYSAAGIIMWRSPERGRVVAATIFLLNVAVVVAVGYLYRSGGAVAVDSVRAMMFRTGVWLVLLLGVLWVVRQGRASANP
jgi:hypothetical protein